MLGEPNSFAYLCVCWGGISVRIKVIFESSRKVIHKENGRQKWTGNVAPSYKPLWEVCSKRVGMLKNVPLPSPKMCSYLNPLMAQQ